MHKQVAASTALQEQCTRRTRAEGVVTRLAATAQRRPDGPAIHAWVHLQVLRWSSRGALDALQALGSHAPDLQVEHVLARWRAGRASDA